jgi:hypothetical protein
MRNRVSVFTRVTICLAALASLTLPENQFAIAEQASALPRSASDIQEAAVEQLAQAFEGASDDDLKKCIQRIVNDHSISAEIWQKMLVSLRDTMCESKKDRAKLYQKLCEEIQAATDDRFGDKSLESTMGHLIYAISHALVEENRKTWDEYDKAVSSGKLADTNPDFLVKSLEALGVIFRATSFDSDSIHAFQLADQIVANHSVSLPVQADLYNTGTDEIFRCSYGVDKNVPVFYKFANSAISVDKRLGSKYSAKLRSVLELKKVQMENEEEGEKRSKDFTKRQEAYNKSLKDSRKH